MAWQAKFTAARGKIDKGQIAIAAGEPEASRDVVSLNVDVDKISKGELLILIDNIRDAVAEAPFPPL